MKRRKFQPLEIGIGLFSLFYMASFIWLELHSASYTVVHSPLDDMIPFCEYFIIPYLLWFIFVFLTKEYFAFHEKYKGEYYKLLATLGTGMLLFLIVSFVFPNGHTLRPELTEGNIFVQIVRILYWIDTPTNILPSLHVYEAVACCTALLLNEDFAKNKVREWGTVILTFSIILATMFLKQHSVVDVVSALVLYAVCYELFYHLLPEKEGVWRPLATKEQICTIPNLLSAARIVMAILFLGIFQRYGMEEMQGVLLGILVLSGITDFLDGCIARKYNMISEVGKIIDPIADKLTQGVVLWCFVGSYPLAKAVLVLFVIKESYMAIAGMKAVLNSGKNEGAKWYGKVSTAVFYGVMAVLVFYRKIPTDAANFLLLVSGACMLMALIMYAKLYHEESKCQEARGVL